MRFMHHTATTMVHFPSGAIDNSTNADQLGDIHRYVSHKEYNAALSVYVVLCAAHGFHHCPTMPTELVVHLLTASDIRAIDTSEAVMRPRVDEYYVINAAKMDITSSTWLADGSSWRHNGRHFSYSQGKRLLRTATMWMTLKQFAEQHTRCQQNQNWHLYLYIIPFSAKHSQLTRYDVL